MKNQSFSLQLQLIAVPGYSLIQSKRQEAVNWIVNQSCLDLYRSCVPYVNGMIEVPISIVAWVSVVLVQALIHYVVFGARRERIQQEEEAVLEEAVLEESLSLSTNESFMEVEPESGSVANKSSSPPTFARPSSPTFDIQSVHSSKTTLSPVSSMIPHRCSASASMLGETMTFEQSPFYLTQTGTELLKVSVPFWA